MEEEISIAELLQLEAEGAFGDDDLDPDTEIFSSFFSESESEEEEESGINYGSTSANKRKENLKNSQRKHLVEKLLTLVDGQNLPKGAISEMAAEFKVHRTTVWRLWSTAKLQFGVGALIDVKSKKKGNVGRKPKVFDLSTFEAIPIRKRTTIRSLSIALEISHSAVYRLPKTGQIRSHTNSIKPKLSHSHMLKRLEYILAQILPRQVHTLPKFSEMYNMVHMDEKWFYMSQQTQRFYLFPWEDDPYRSCQNKKFIGKVMFLAVVARPHVSAQGAVTWDGKIGIFPFTEVVYAQRNSTNRVAGTPETKAIQSVTRDIIRSKLIYAVLPAIREKWPSNGCKDIWIQQDNARPHIGVHDEEFTKDATSFGFNIRLTCQPAQSPNFNILDLGFFRAIQSIQYKSFPRDVNELVNAVQDAYYAFEPRLLNYTWLHLQYIMIEVLRVKGGNNYKNPHAGKRKMDKLGLLPTNIDVPEDLISDARHYLMDGQIQLSTGVGSNVTPALN